jgi:hypothetical protein
MLTYDLPSTMINDSSHPGFLKKNLFENKNLACQFWNMARQEKNIDEKNSKISESGEGEEKRNGEAALASQHYHIVRSYMAWMIVVCSLHGWMDGWMDGWMIAPKTRAS